MLHSAPRKYVPRVVVRSREVSKSLPHTTVDPSSRPARSYAAVSPREAPAKDLEYSIRAKTCRQTFQTRRVRPASRGVKLQAGPCPSQGVGVTGNVVAQSLPAGRGGRAAAADDRTACSYGHPGSRSSSQSLDGRAAKRVRTRPVRTTHLCAELSSSSFAISLKAATKCDRSASVPCDSSGCLSLGTRGG